MLYMFLLINYSKLLISFSFWHKSSLIYWNISSNDSKVSFDQKKYTQNPSEAISSKKFNCWQDQRLYVEFASTWREYTFDICTSYSRNLDGDAIDDIHILKEHYFLYYLNVLFSIIMTRVRVRTGAMSSTR